MSQPLEINHEIIRDYISNKINSTDLDILIRRKEQEPSLNQLLQIIDELKKPAGSAKEAKSKNIPDSFSDIDSVILELQSGKIKPARAKAILNLIVQSPQFFEKFYTRLSQVTSLQVEGDLPELQEVTIKTDDMILEELGVLKKEKSANKFEELVDRIRGLFVEKPRLAYAISTALAAILILVIVITPPSAKDPFESYIYTNKVPYEFDISSFRGQTDYAELNPLLVSFINQFKMGISDYMLCDYENAIKTWEELKLIADELESNLPNVNSIPWIREYHFYLGVSYLALGRNQDLDQKESEKFLKKSIEYLLQSESLVSKYSLKNGDKENYFLGLAYGILGITNDAVKYFQKINPSFKYYNESKNILIDLLNT